MITADKAKVVAEIVLTADRIETDATLEGNSFEDAVMQYCKHLGITREEVQQIMDTKLREIVCR